LTLWHDVIVASGNEHARGRLVNGRHRAPDCSAAEALAVTRVVNGGRLPEKQTSRCIHLEDRAAERHHVVRDEAGKGLLTGRDTTIQRTCIQHKGRRDSGGRIRVDFAAEPDQVTLCRVHAGDTCSRGADVEKRAVRGQHWRRPTRGLAEEVGLAEVIRVDVATPDDTAAGELHGPEPT
jgi:hypothetical protein